MIYRSTDGTVVERRKDVTTTTLPDGLQCSNWVVPVEQAEVAAHLGFDDQAQYVWEHEVCHVMVPLVIFGERGYVARMSAMQRTMFAAAARAEERLIWYVQAAVAGRIDAPPGLSDAVDALRVVQADVRAPALV